MIQLKNNRLSINIESPYSVYTGSRFDGSGIISSINFANHSFCQVEQEDVTKGSGGIGFCNEFGIDQAIDYDTTNVGEKFPKIGVGLVEKDTDEDYDFFAKAKVVQSEVLEEVTRIDSYKVRTHIKDDKYNILLTKVVSIKENKLIIDYLVENNGLTPIKTNEYNHNFIGINHDNIGENYRLTLYNLSEVQKVVGDFIITKDNLEHRITWDNEPNGDFYALTTQAERSSEYNWELVHLKYGLGIRECSTFKVSKVALWGYNHVVCPEVFINISLEPKQSMSWTRKYEFFTI